MIVYNFYAIILLMLMYNNKSSLFRSDNVEKVAKNHSYSKTHGAMNNYHTCIPPRFISYTKFKKG